MALADQIGNAEDRKPEPLDMSDFGWPDGIFIKPFSGADAIKMESLVEDEENPTSEESASAMHSLYMRSLVDADGAEIFAEETISKLMGRSMVALKHLMKEIKRINGMSEEGVAELGKA